MNILVIGNGFDLAHGLPTKYTDFLEWIVAEYDYFEVWKKQKNEVVSHRRELKLNVPEGRQRKQIVNGRIEHQEELWDCIDDNNWIEHFLYCNMNKKKNWIDFETEIANVVKSIDCSMQGNIDGPVTNLDNWLLSNKYIESKLDFGYEQIQYIT